MTATELDPLTHCAAICISTSTDPHARQQSAIIMNSSIILDLIKSGDFDIKKIVNIAEDVIR